MLATTAAGEQLLEGVAVVARKQRINERVDGRVAVAQPEEDGKEKRRRAVSAEGLEQVGREERTPANHKAPHNDAYRLGGLLLALQALGMCAPLHASHSCQVARLSDAVVVLDAVTPVFSL